MPRIPTITARESPLVGAPQSQASGEDFGAGIGRAMQGLGNTIAQVGAQFGGIGEQQRAEKDLMDVTTAYANSSHAEDFNNTVTSYPDPSGKGLTEVVDGNYDTWMNNKIAEFAATGASKKAQDAYKIQLLQDKRMYTGKAAEEATVMGLNHAKIQSETGLSTIINDVRSNGLTSETDFNIQLSKGIQLLATRPGFSAIDKEAGIRKLTSDLSQARFSAMADAQTTVLGIEAVAEELADPRWEARFGQAEYDQQKRYIESARTSIQTQARAIIDSTIESLSARAGNVAIPADEWDQKIAEIAAQGPMTVPQAAKLERIRVQNEELRSLQGFTAGDVNALNTPGVTSPGSGVRISYTNQNAIRNRPVTPQLAALYSTAANAAGIDEVRIVSGGQARLGSGGKRIGSTRHDDVTGTGGHAGDIQLLKNGRVLSTRNPADMPHIITFMRTAWTSGATGIGAGEAYMGSSTFHVGFGAKAVWSSTRSGQPVVGWLREATSGPGGSGGGGGAINPQLQAISNRHGVDANMMDGIYFAESSRGANPNDSPKGAKGPFGFMDATWRQYGNGGDVYNFDDAADASARMMSDLLNQFHGDVDLALMAYNWGEGNVRDWIKEGKDPAAIPKETRDYVERVKANGGGGGGVVTSGGGMTGEQYDRSVVRDRFVKDQQAGLNSGVMDYLQTPNGGSQLIDPIDIGVSPEILAGREQIYENTKAKFGLEPSQMKPLTGAEASKISQIMATGDPMQQLAALGLFSNWSKANQEAAYEQIGAKDKVAGYAGGMAANGQEDLAFEALQGRTSLTNMKEQGEVKWKTDADEYFRTNWGSNPALRGLDPAIVDAMKGTADAIMAHRMKNTGNEYDESDYAKVWAEVLGQEVENVNGTDMVMPTDVTADRLEAALEVMSTDDWAARSTYQTPPVGADLQPLEGWQLEGAEFVVINSENDYKVVVDGQPVMTLNPVSGEPEAFIMKVEADWIEDIELRTRAGYIPPGSAASPEGSTATVKATSPATTGNVPIVQAPTSDDTKALAEPSLSEQMAIPEATVSAARTPATGFVGRGRFVGGDARLQATKRKEMTDRGKIMYRDHLVRSGKFSSDVIERMVKDYNPGAR